MLVDLTVPINEQTPVYPGDPATKIAPAGQIAKDGYNDHFVSIGTHVGTHMDAPNHMLENGKTLDTFNVNQFVGRGRLVTLKDDAFDLKKLEDADIQEGDIVLFQSGMNKKYHEAEYFENYPAMPKEIAEYLVKKKAKMVGIDMCSPDHDEFIAHKILLAGDVLIIENLTNLEMLEGKEFTIYAFPIKLQLDGAPARVVAEIT
ncbi:cyclase family protein [Patescibacteria group bacterium]|nr:MAG: cyclase family protein [Patescibacteria group bacterium]